MENFCYAEREYAKPGSCAKPSFDAYQTGKNAKTQPGIAMNESEKWDEHYLTGEPPWDTGMVSRELQRVIGELGMDPCRLLEIGCGTGTNAIWLAQQGFDVVAIDWSAVAISQAWEKSQNANVKVRFEVADVLNLPYLGEPFEMFFDRGCYHAVRREDPMAYAKAIVPFLAPHALGLVLAGNAKEPRSPGPPVVTEEEIRRELGSEFDIRHLREFRFEGRPGSDESFLAWSCLVQRMGG